LPTPAVPSETYTETQAKAALEAVEQILEMVEDFFQTNNDAQL
jgi:HEPN domain-containing protein